MWRVLAVGILIWIAGTLAIRLWGEYFLLPGRPGVTLLLYLVCFPAMLLLSRSVCRWLLADRKSWVRGVGFLILPTLILDPLSCLFFAQVFPNVAPAAAGVFGGLMLICCGGAVAGVLVKT